MSVCASSVASSKRSNKTNFSKQRYMKRHKSTMSSCSSQSHKKKDGYFHNDQSSVSQLSCASSVSSNLKRKMSNININDCKSLPANVLIRDQPFLVNNSMKGNRGRHQHGKLKKQMTAHDDVAFKHQLC